MITISEHTFEESLIKNSGWVLDLGCINFTFAKEIKKYTNNIICVDPNPHIKYTDIPKEIFYEKAAIITEDDIIEKKFFLYNDKNGNSLLNPPKDWCNLIDEIIVPTTTIPKIMMKYNIDQFDLIKFDIEGSEYDILKNIDWTLSKQYSIEFHDFRNMNPNYPLNESYYENIFEKMLKYCYIAKHHITDHPGFPNGMGRNYWDSLFILKEEFRK